VEHGGEPRVRQRQGRAGAALRLRVRATENTHHLEGTSAGANLKSVGMNVLEIGLVFSRHQLASDVATWCTGC
jgi:hypothetical protein